MRILKAISAALASAFIANAAYPIPGTFTGLGPASGQRPARRNILSLQNDYYQWPLYIQALAAFHAANQNDLLSYYQIAGIHGRPYTSWDNAHGPNDNSYTGYCTHDSPLFVTWHRPYLALYEQVLARRVQSIAQQYIGKPDQARWLDAANKFRIPYWDWAETQTMPPILSQPQISILSANGQITINNPLYTYRFHPLNPVDFPPGSGFLATQPQTIRGSNINTLLTAWNVKSNTYTTFNEGNYLRYVMQSSGGASIESVHGTVHVAVAGGDGNRHMAQLGYSAFDPVFWLHHANVDRLAAMWQAIWQDRYLPTGGAIDPYGTYAINPGTRVYPTTPLLPFWRASSYWNSNNVRSTAAFGYTYPELNDWSRSLNQQRTDAAAAVNVLYGPFSFVSKRDNNTDVETRRQWYAAVSCRKFALDSSYTVILFLGEPPANSGEWYTASNLVGLMPVLVPAVKAPLVPGTSPSEMTTNMDYLLDDALVKAGVYDRSADVLEPYLHENLTWKILKLDGTVVAVEDVPDLRIRVYDRAMTPPSVVTELPTYGIPHDRPDATKGKPGSVV